jgi:tetratricopeptide (TPR) repeat protein
MTGAIVRRSAALGALVFGLVFTALPASAQNGSIRGKVLDVQGNPVEGAKIEIQSLDKGGRPLEVKTKKDGTYMQVGLSPGQYKITASKADLSQSQNTKIGLDMLTLDFKLAPGGTSGGSKEDAAKAKAKAEAMNKAFSEGVELSNQGKTDEAIAKFQEVIAAVPACAECYANIGTVQARAKKYDEAEAAYKKSLEIKPDFAEAYNGLANLYNTEKKFDQAAEMSKKAMELSSAASAGAPGGATTSGGNASAIFNQGVILWNAGKIPEATAQFEQTVKLDPNMADAHYWLGMARLNGGKIPEGVAEFEAYLKLVPECTPVINGDTSNASLVDKCKSAVQAAQTVKALKK